MYFATVGLCVFRGHLCLFAGICVFRGQPRQSLIKLAEETRGNTVTGKMHFVLQYNTWHSTAIEYLVSY